MKKRIVTVYGTRPEAIKVAPVVGALREDSRFETVVINTGQHKEMLQQVEDLFEIEPDFRLSIMRPNQTLNGIVSNAIHGLDDTFTISKPDVVVVQGDTSTAMAAAITAFNSGIKVVHLEAGLRTGCISSPFPEEANRKLIAQVTSLHLAPTPAAAKNLQSEGIEKQSIVVTGNTVIDALLEVHDKNILLQNKELSFRLSESAFKVLVTTHRRENISAMKSIGTALGDLADRYPNVLFVLPAHLNPNVRKALLPEVEGKRNFLVTDALPYGDFISLMAKVDLVLTDSGGVQEEAPSLGKPVLVMRANTERPEAVQAGTVRLVGTNPEVIVRETSNLLEDPKAYAKMANAVNPYGDGKAAARTCAAIGHLCGMGDRPGDFFPNLI